MAFNNPIGLNLMMLLADQLIDEGKRVSSCPDRLSVDEKQAAEIANKLENIAKDFSQLSNSITLQREKKEKRFSIDTCENGLCFIVHDSD